MRDLGPGLPEPTKHVFIGTSAFLFFLNFAVTVFELEHLLDVMSLICMFSFSMWKGLNVNCTDSSGYTPLHHAALNGHRYVFRTLY